MTVFLAKGRGVQGKTRTRGEPKTEGFLTSPTSFATTWFCFFGRESTQSGHPRVNPVEQKKQIPRCARDDMFFCLWKKEPQDAGLKARRYKTWICAGVPVPRGWGAV
jgi:hypothetical protein